MTKDYLGGKIGGYAYCLDFPYELEKRHKKVHREDDDYCDLIYECLYEEGVVHGIWYRFFPIFFRPSLDVIFFISIRLSIHL